MSPLSLSREHSSPNHLSSPSSVASPTASLLSFASSRTMPVILLSSPSPLSSLSHPMLIVRKWLTRPTLSHSLQSLVSRIEEGQQNASNLPLDTSCSRKSLVSARDDDVVFFLRLPESAGEAGGLVLSASGSGSIELTFFFAFPCSHRHPSGFFKRGDNSQLPLIIRKTRNRPEKRRASTSSMPQEHEHSPPPPLPASHYQPQDYRSQYNPDGYRQHPNFTTPAFQPTFPPLRSLQQPDSSMPLSWRPYTPPTTNWSQPTSSASYAPISAHHQPQQRLSVGDFKLSPSTLGPSPRSKLEELGPPPRLRKANSTLSIQTTAHPSADDTYRSPYPTPTFSNYASHHAYSSSSSTTSPNLIPSGLPMAYEGPSPSSYTTGPSSSSYTHLSHGAPSGPSSTSAPVTLPSPTYSSSSSDHTPFPSESTTTTNTTTNTSVLDPRHLSRSSSTNPSSYFAPPPPPPLNRSHSHEQQVSWSPALRPILDNGGEHYPSSYGGNSR